MIRLENADRTLWRWPRGLSWQICSLGPPGRLCRQRNRGARPLGCSTSRCS